MLFKQNFSMLLWLVISNTTLWSPPSQGKLANQELLTAQGENQYYFGQTGLSVS